MSVNVGAADFAPFFRAVHGYEPFPWQNRLAQQVFDSGWPDALDIPTGAGKTAAIDIAVFHLALEADRRSERRAPVRILFVVDRRLVVDDAYERAARISSALAHAGDGIVAHVADRLGLLAENRRMPLAVVRLRGGMPKEPDWVRTPAQATVVVSTVDQVGSRVLFRGYGVSDTMKPVHAGLLGADALLFLDEAHLSQPFVQTMQDTRTFQESAPWSANAAPAPFGIVKLSATQTADDPFRIGDEDRLHGQLGKRLRSSKPAELIASRSKADDRAFAEEFADKAWELSKVGGGGATVVAVVVNRVRRARAVFDALCGKGARPLPETSEDSRTNEVDESDAVPADVALLIGRVRDLDRDETMKNLLPRTQAGRDLGKLHQPLFVVATQCIEAGADLDFDALVTEIAPLDCLRQRFGRLNRMGREIDARAAILAAADQVSKSATDPLYGLALLATWNLLVEKSSSQGKGKATERVIDFGIAQSEEWLPKRSELDKCLAPHADAPVLLPRDIELWSRTSPVPVVDPEVSLYLHGPAKGPGDVEIVWRSDLFDGDDDSIWHDRVRVCPPSTLEAISIPIGEAKRWLRGEAAGDITDVEADRYNGDGRPINIAGRKALRWRGANDEKTGPICAAELRPGDVIVVPALRGGCDRWGWTPKAKSAKEEAVRDYGREANRRHRGRDILRLTRATPELSLIDDSERQLSERLEDLSDGEVIEEVERLLSQAGEPSEMEGFRVLRSDNGQPLALERRMARHVAGGDAVTEDDGSIRASRKSVRLDDHSAGVELYAERFAEQLGFPPEMCEDIALSGFLHDAGKAHPAFKRLLYNGDELASVAGPDLAKGTRLPSGPRAWQEAQRRAGVPKGARHELASLSFSQAHPRFAKAYDHELVLWLIGTHHGYGRPFFPAVAWPDDDDTFETDLGDGLIQAQPARSLTELTAQWIDLFFRLQSRYGPWGLARLEAILRLADHRRSEAEQGEGET